MYVCSASVVFVASDVSRFSGLVLWNDVRGFVNLSGYQLADHASLGYRRTVLVIWSERNNARVLYISPAGLQRACRDLLSAQLGSVEERSLGQFVTSSAPTYQRLAMATLCKVKRRHGDLTRWTDIIKGSARALGGLETVDDREKLEALEKWALAGWDTLQEAYVLYLNKLCTR